MQEHQSSLLCNYLEKILAVQEKNNFCLRNLLIFPHNFFSMKELGVWYCQNSSITLTFIGKENGTPGPHAMNIKGWRMH